MKRRDFIAANFALWGGVVIGDNITYADAIQELGKAFTSIDPEKGYDLIVNGAGFAGCFAALAAAGKGMRVLVVDKRTSPGFELAAKRQLWLKTEGKEKWPAGWDEWFCPEAEKKEVFNRRLSGLNNSCAEDEMLFFAGSIKKGLLRTLLANKIDVMLMTDMWGVLADEKGNVSGATVACKQGIFAIPCKHILDATDNNFFARNLVGEKYNIDSAGFVLELDNADTDARQLVVDPSVGVIGNSVELHRGKKTTDQCFLSYKFMTKGHDLSLIEQKAREIAGIIGENVLPNNKELSKAKIRYYALECSYQLNKKKLPKVSIAGFQCVQNNSYEINNILSLLDKYAAADKAIGSIRATNGSGHYVYVYYSGKKARIPFQLEKKSLTEYGSSLPLIPFPVKQLEIETIECPLLVAGGGTAGTTAALSAAEKGANPLLVEYFNDLGGSKTMGGVTGYYLGLNKHPYIVSLEKEIKKSAQEHNMTGAVSRSFYHYDSLKPYIHTIINGAIICGAYVKEHLLEKILVCQNGSIKWLKSPLTIDATGDADIASFAGEGFELGNTRMGVTQNYSQWDLPYRNPKFPFQTVNTDYDIIDNTRIQELQRGLYLSHYESMYYDFYPMLTVRESRRPEGLYRLNVNDVLNQTYFDDTIVNSNSDFDPHHFGASEYTRCGFLLPHSNQLTANIPYRSIVPAKTDGLLLSGRGISQTHNALQFTRMSADVALLGHATGQIAAEIINSKRQPRSFSVAGLQKKWIEGGFILTGKQPVKESAGDITEKLAGGNKDYLAICCRQEKNTILLALQAKYDSTPSVLAAKALAWFGDKSGNALIREELEEWFAQEQQVGHPDRYYEKYDASNLYWRINQSIALLGMTNDKDNTGLIAHILSRTSDGGAKVKAADAYNQNRIDLYLIPFYNRIVNLCFYIERNPDSAFTAELERLLQNKEIKSQVTAEYQSTRWRVYGSMLELSIASAAARCGSKQGILVLTDYLNDVHSDFRRFAGEELGAVKEGQIAPLKKKIEL